VYKRNFNSFIVTLLHLYSQNYIVMEEMEIKQNGEDPNSQKRDKRKTICLGAHIGTMPLMA
jgi:hypothetical protein